tara:strand:- start:9697 stop:9882 length:186 start_codon:yes stop_codon:yes gene_type:complete
MKPTLLLTLIAIGLAGCAAPPDSEDGSTGQSSDNAGFISGGGFSKESDPISKHQEYIGQGY